MAWRLVYYTPRAIASDGDQTTNPKDNAPTIQRDIDVSTKAKTNIRLSADDRLVLSDPPQRGVGSTTEPCVL